MSHRVRNLQNIIEKAKKYLKKNKQPPEGYTIKQGPKGGRYYDTEEHPGQYPKLKRMPAFRKQENGELHHSTREGLHGPGTYKISQKDGKHHVSFTSHNGKSKKLGTHDTLKDAKLSVKNARETASKQKTKSKSKKKETHPKDILQPSGIKSPEDAINKTHQIMVDKINEVSKKSKIKINPDEVLGRSQGILDRLIENSEVRMRMPDVALIKMLRDGKFKNQHETKTTRGYVDEKGARKKIEQISDDTPDDEYPKYGYLHDKRNEYEYNDVGDDSLGSYGNIIIKFKDSVREHTTFCFGDSLNDIARINGWTGEPSWECNSAISKLSDPKVESLGYSGIASLSKKGTIKHKYGKDSMDTIYAREIENSFDNPVNQLEDVFKHAYWYGAEAQIHGKLTIDDIESIYIQKPHGNTNSEYGYEDLHRILRLLVPRGIDIHFDANFAFNDDEEW